MCWVQYLPLQFEFSFDYLKDHKGLAGMELHVRRVLKGMIFILIRQYNLEVKYLVSFPNVSPINLLWCHSQMCHHILFFFMYLLFLVLDFYFVDLTCVSKSSNMHAVVTISASTRVLQVIL